MWMQVQWCDGVVTVALVADGGDAREEKPKDGDTENTRSPRMKLWNCDILMNDVEGAWEKSQPFGQIQGSCEGWESDSIIQVNIFRSSDSSSSLQVSGRYSVIGAQPTMEIVAKENMVTVMDHHEGRKTEEFVEDPMVASIFSDVQSGRAAVQMKNALYVTGGFDGKSYSRHEQEEGLPFDSSIE
ncbi:hypothetical protein L2E82_30717 [Cichorium intybus]|uniref:Uncharacterized protein n=1 Tax=Cichorium intybus TaxID=13427 RepID=A0ACB9D1M0_CICIN|nr:hypothetical protein L2E82_30717 [Cichorium intybus]